MRRMNMMQRHAKSGFGRARLNYLVDVVLLISFFISGLTGYILMEFGQETFVGNNETLNLHKLSGQIMVLAIFIHLLLHWKWMVTMTQNIFSRKRPHSD